MNNDLLDEPIVIRTHEQLRGLKRGYKKQAAEGVFAFMFVAAVALTLAASVALFLGQIQTDQINMVTACSIYFCTLSFFASLYQADH